MNLLVGALVPYLKTGFRVVYSLRFPMPVHSNLFINNKLCLATPGFHITFIFIQFDLIIYVWNECPNDVIVNMCKREHVLMRCCK